MPAHLLSIPSPSGEEGVDTETTILRLVAIDSTATAEREREGGRLWRERETARGDAGRMQQRWLRERCREREILSLRGELLWSESNGPQGRGI